MFVLGIMVSVAGMYAVLVALGVLHRGFLKPGEEGPRRLGIILFGGGMFIVGLYGVYHAYTVQINRRSNVPASAPMHPRLPGKNAPGSAPGSRNPGRNPLFPARPTPQNPR